MKAIYKYAVDNGSITLPMGAQVRHVGMQGEQVMLWAEIDTATTEHEKRRFTIVGTGQPLTETEVYIGTVFDGMYVWHVCEARDA